MQLFQRRPRRSGTGALKLSKCYQLYNQRRDSAGVPEQQFLEIHVGQGLFHT